MHPEDPIQPMDSIQQVDPTAPVQQSHPNTVQPTPATNKLLTESKPTASDADAEEFKTEPEAAHTEAYDSAAYRYIPQGVQGWNWGAFMFNVYWGLGNKSYLPLLCLIPFFNVIWMFVCGIKGNEWAWINGDYPDVATFQAVQKTWNRAGLFAFILATIGIILFILMYPFIFAAIFVNFQNDGRTTY